MEKIKAAQLKIYFTPANLVEYLKNREIKYANFNSFLITLAGEEFQRKLIPRANHDCVVINLSWR